MLAGHFPGRPIVPGVILLEGLAQLTGVVVLGESSSEQVKIRLVGVDKARFKQAIRPGDQVIFYSKITRRIKEQWVAECVAEIQGTMAVSATLRLHFNLPRDK